MAGAFGDHGLGVEGDAQAGNREHGEIVGAITHRDGLLEVDVFGGGMIGAAASAPSGGNGVQVWVGDRKSTRLNSSHG